MEIAITGNNSGIGLALEKIFPFADNYSRTNGYDLTEERCIDRISRSAFKNDVFVNNAHCGFKQVELLYSMFNVWQDLDKTIICIGSNSNEGNKDFVSSYAVEKDALEKACDQLNNLGAKCKVILIKPGYVDTPRVAGIKAKKIDPADIAKFIHYMLISPKSFWIPKITMVP